jgi:alpha-beta hydrolase superfamily lysophospholipase
MDSKSEVIVHNDGHKTILNHFYSLEEPKASILVLHGMAEHHKRYYAFANYLNTQGFDVYLYDHRGHGSNVIMKDLGYFSDSNGHITVVNDALEIIQHINKINRSNKLFLLGHSMGSLIARNVIQKYDDFTGVILCGSTHPGKVKTKSGIIITSIIKKLQGPRHRSPFINNMMFGSKAYTSLINRTAFDWLSRNNSSVGAYIHDPYCGYVCTISFYKDLLKIVTRATSAHNMKKTQTTLPIFIISGNHDPVSNYGKEINHLFSLYKKYGFNRTSMKLYPECRHELLQELNSGEIMKDIHSWILQQL